MYIYTVLHQLYCACTCTCTTILWPCILMIALQTDTCILQCICLCHICVAYVVKEFASFLGLGQLMDMAYVLELYM